MIQRQAPIFRPSYSAGGGGGGSTFAFPLPAGNAMPAANLTMRMIHPRPDSDGGINSWEKHKLHPSGIPLFIPIGVIGGIPPYRYTISTDMAGLTVGQDMPTDWIANGLQTYGCMLCANPSIGSYTTTLTITDQAGTSVSSTCTHSVVDRDDTTKFLWYAPSTGNNANSGSYSSPYKDDLSLAMGAASSTTTIQGQVWIKEAGTITPAKHTDLTNSIRLDNTKRPVVICALRNTSYVRVAAVLSMTATRFNSINGGNATGGYFDFAIDGSNSALFTDYQPFLIDDSQNRISFVGMTWTNVGVGSAGSDNPSMVFFTTGATSSDSTYNHYILFRGCTETGRPSGSNSYSLTSAYGIKYALFEDCHTYTSNAETEIYLKDSCQEVTIRYCSFDNNNSGAYGVGASGGQNQNGGTTTNLEYVYSFFDGLNTSGRGIRFNASDASNGIGNGFTSRCTFRGSWSALGSGGTYKATNDVIYTSSTPIDAGSNSMTSAGTELQGNTAYFDSSGKLTATYAAYRGTRGWEIFDS